MSENGGQTTTSRLPGWATSCQDLVMRRCRLLSFTFNVWLLAVVLVSLFWLVVFNFYMAEPTFIPRSDWDTAAGSPARTTPARTHPDGSRSHVPPAKADLDDSMGKIPPVKVDLDDSMGKIPPVKVDLDDSMGKIPPVNVDLDDSRSRMGLDGSKGMIQPPFKTFLNGIVNQIVADGIRPNGSRGTVVPLPDDINEVELPVMTFGKTTDRGNGLTFAKGEFFLNNRPFRVFSGAMHYFRIFPEYWEDRLKKLKACGLNTVETYVAWNLHEPSPGVFNFRGMLDIRRFVSLAASLGFYVIIRPGPYICSEFEFGGLPAWLLNDPHMEMRTNYPGYLAAVNRFFSVILPMLNSLQFSHGGPIIMYQVENEYGSYGDNIQHLKMLLYLMTKYGVKELFVTSDHRSKDRMSEDTSFDFSKYALMTDNFDTIWSNSFGTFKTLNRDFPLMVMELWTGWFDFWGKGYHSVTSLEMFKVTLDYLMDAGASFNLYMFTGGTNFGFTSGSNNGSEFQPTTTSYDYNALLTEAGDVTVKYHTVRSLLQKFYDNQSSTKLPEIPPNSAKAYYGELRVKEEMSWDTFLSVIPAVARGQRPSHMETYRSPEGLMSALGYIVYSYTARDFLGLTAMIGSHLRGNVRDRLTGILNGDVFFVKDYLNTQNFQFPVYRWEKPFGSSKADNSSDTQEHRNEYDYVLSEPNWHYEFVQKLQETRAATTDHRTRTQRLDLLVECQGRINFSSRQAKLFNHQRKGFSGREFPGRNDMAGGMWEVRLINFSPQQSHNLSRSSAWSKFKPYVRIPKSGETSSPRLYRSFLTILEDPMDTFIKLEGWEKGVVIVNNFNLGRYWSIGPQKTLYLPAPLLKPGTNEILIFEESRRGQKLVFQDFPELG